MHLLEALRSWPIRRELRAHLIHYTDSAPHPTGSRTTSIPGRDPLKVLLLGSGLVVGYGVTDRRDAVDGHLARALAGRTGRGVVLVNHAARDRPLMEQVFETRLTDPATAFDLVVWSPSTLDACARPVPPGWSGQLRRLIDLLETRTPVVVLGLASTRDPSPEQAPAAHLAELLNAELTRAARGFDDVVVVHVPEVSLESYGHPALACRYFAELADRIAGAHRSEPVRA